MNGHDFIFSSDLRYRLLRHGLFWVLWWGYFTLIYFHYQQTGLQTIGFDPWNRPLLVKSVFLLLLHMVACYSFTGYLLPGFVKRSHKGLLLTGVTVLIAFIVVAGYYLHSAVFPLVDAAFQHRPLKAHPDVWWPSISSGLLSTPQVIAAATAIKLMKRWHREQKEKEQVEQEKLATDLQLLKAQIQPRFLFTALDSIHRLARKKDTSGASALLLKLADLLSYTLYEGDRKWVPLDNELRTIRDYMTLEKTRLGRRLELDIALRGEAGDKTIAPLLLLPFIEAAFAYCDDRRTDKCWINLELRVEDEWLLLKLIHGKAAGKELPARHGEALANVQKRLALIYPGAYELKTTADPEIMMTSLKLSLAGGRPGETATINPKQQSLYANV
jgi:hypothetical protein